MVAIGLALLPAERATAANPQPYTTVIEKTGSNDLDVALEGSSLLVTLRQTAPAPPFGVIQRAREDLSRFETVLHGFGHYLGKAAITIAGRELDDPDLPMVLEDTPAGRAVEANIRIDPGPLYKLRTITVTGPIPPEAKDAHMLQTGDPAEAAAVQEGGRRLLAAIEELGYPFARVEEPVAVADDAAHVLDVTFSADSGPRALIGQIDFNGLTEVSGDFVRRIVTVKTGDLYQPGKLEQSRRALLATGVFAGVSITPGSALDAQGRIPILFSVEERPRRAVRLEGDFSTDLGVRLTTGWSHRNLFGNGEQLNLGASGTGLFGNATGDVIGYRLSAQFIKPAFLRTDQALQLDLVGLRQSLLAYDQELVSAGGSLVRTISPRWKASAGGAYMAGRVTQKGVERDYQLLSFPLTAGYDSTGLTDPLADPRSGMRASFSVTPAQAFGARPVTFVLVQTAASAYFDLSGDGRSVIAARALVGAALGASVFDLPPDQRLYAGGSTTVRGYRFQSIGPLFPDNDPIGGTAVDAGTLEFRQRVFSNWGFAAFVDAGQASTKGVPFTGTLRAGAGGGVRYYTSVGAIRADIAFPLNPPNGANAFEFYIGLGQAF